MPTPSRQLRQHQAPNLRAPVAEQPRPRAAAGCWTSSRPAGGALVAQASGRGPQIAFHAVPMAEAHLTPAGPDRPGGQADRQPGGPYAIAGVGALIVLVAAINFVTLMTARAARRGVEVGVRKATGARRGDLMIQFIGRGPDPGRPRRRDRGGLGGDAGEARSTPSCSGSLALDFVHDPAAARWAWRARLCSSACWPRSIRPWCCPASGRRPCSRAASSRPSGSPLARAGAGGGPVRRPGRADPDHHHHLPPDPVRPGPGPGRRGQQADRQRLRPLRQRLPGGGAQAAGRGRRRPAPRQRAATRQHQEHHACRSATAGRRASTWRPVDFGFFELYGVKPLAGRLFSPRPRRGRRSLADPKATAHAVGGDQRDRRARPGLRRSPRRGRPAR